MKLVNLGKLSDDALAKIDARIGRRLGPGISRGRRRHLVDKRRNVMDEKMRRRRK